MKEGGFLESGVPAWVAVTGVGLGILLAGCDGKRGVTENGPTGPHANQPAIDRKAHKGHEGDGRGTRFSELFGEIREDPVGGFESADRVPAENYHKLTPEDQRDLKQLCRTVALLRQVPMEDRVRFCVERLPTSALPNVLDDVIMDSDEDGLRYIQKILTSETFPVGKARVDLYASVADRWFRLGKSRDWLEEWAQSLDFPEESTAVKAVIAHHFSNESLR